MGDGFRGVSADRDGRFNLADKKLMAKMKFPAEFVHKVNMTKVHLEVLKGWVTKKVTAYLGGIEDDIIISMVMAELERENEPDPRRIQINLTGFLERNTGAFMSELWQLLLSAQENFQPGQKGIPSQLLKEKADEIKRINQELQESARKIAENQDRFKGKETDKDGDRTRPQHSNEREANPRRGFEQREGDRARSAPRQSRDAEPYREEQRRSRSRDRDERRGPRGERWPAERERGGDREPQARERRWERRDEWDERDGRDSGDRERWDGRERRGGGGGRERWDRDERDGRRDNLEERSGRDGRDGRDWRNDGGGQRGGRDARDGRQSPPARGGADGGGRR